jgi:hypothetical protein
VPEDMPQTRPVDVDSDEFKNWVKSVPLKRKEKHERDKESH